MPLTYKDLSLMNARSNLERSFYNPAVPRPTEFISPSQAKPSNPTQPPVSNPSPATNNAVNSVQTQQLQNRGMPMVPMVPMANSRGQGFQFQNINEVKDFQNGRSIDDIEADRAALARQRDPYSNSGVFGLIPGLREQFKYAPNATGGFRTTWEADQIRLKEYNQRHNPNSGTGGNGTSFTPVNPTAPQSPGVPGIQPPGLPGLPNSPSNPNSPGNNAPSPNPTNPSDPNNPASPNPSLPPNPLPINPINPNRPNSNIPDRFTPGLPIPKPPGLPNGGFQFQFPPVPEPKNFTVESQFERRDYYLRFPERRYFPDGNGDNPRGVFNGFGIPISLEAIKVPNGVYDSDYDTNTAYAWQIWLTWKQGNSTVSYRQLISSLHDSANFRVADVTIRVYGGINATPIPTTVPSPPAPLPPDWNPPKLDDILDGINNINQQLQNLQDIVAGVQNIQQALQDLKPAVPVGNPIPKREPVNTPKSQPAPKNIPAPKVDFNPKGDPKNVHSPSPTNTQQASPQTTQITPTGNSQVVPKNNPVMNPVGNSGQISPAKQEQIQQQQQPQPVPNQVTPSLCNDPCIADIQRRQREQEDENKDKTVDITVPIFKACKVDSGSVQDGDNDGVDDDIATFDNVNLKVPASMADVLKKMFERTFELEKQKCRQIDIAMPETMALRVPDGRPILKITYREVASSGKIKQSKWVTQIPWYTAGKQGVPKSTYQHGDTRVAYSFKDGSLIVINASNETEGKRMVRQLLKGTDQTKSKGGTYKITKSTKDAVDQDKMKAVKLTPISAAFYPNGDGFINGVRATPEWTVNLKKSS